MPTRTPDDIARAFHEAYERLAPEHGYQTRRASAVPWEDVPESNKALMVATVSALLDEGVITAAPEAAQELREHIAAQIEAVVVLARRDQDPAEAKAEAYATAARIARGEA